MRIFPVKLHTNFVSKNQIKQSNKQISFKASTHDDFDSPHIYEIIEVDEKKINLLKGSPYHMSHVGEVLRDTPDDVIREHYAQCKTLGFENKRKSAKAYERLMPYVAAARQKYDDIQDKLSLMYMFYETNDAFVGQIIKLEKEARRMEEVANTTGQYRTSRDITPSEPDREMEEKLWDVYMY